MSKKSPEIQDLLFDEAGRWINDRLNAEGGALYDWNENSILQFKDTPVETLLLDDYFLGLKDTLYDSVYQDIVDLWAERKKRPVNSAYFLESIGAGKSMKASIIIWLQWFEICMHMNPQRHYNLVDDSVIALMLLSRTEVQSRRVAFGYTWNFFQSQFNKDYFPANPKYSREIRINRNNTCVYAGTSSALSALGYNVYGGIIDEANFLEVIEDSKKGDDDLYDAGQEIYNALINRMTSRFMKDGRIPGTVACISSPRFPDSFIERKIQECKSVGPENVNAFYRSRSLWEAKGPKFYPGFFHRNEYFEVDTETLKIVSEKGIPV